MYVSVSADSSFLPQPSPWKPVDSPNQLTKPGDEISTIMITIPPSSRSACYRGAEEEESDYVPRNEINPSRVDGRDADGTRVSLDGKVCPPEHERDLLSRCRETG